MTVIDLATMSTIKSLDEAARASGVSRRLIQKWLGEKRLTAYSIAGDRRRFVDVDEIKKLREPRALPPTSAR
jgi:excisionase family DNA binding protein